MPYGDCICKVPGCVGTCVTRAKNETPELSPYETGLCLLWLRDRYVIDTRELAKGENTMPQHVSHNVLQAGGGGSNVDPKAINGTTVDPKNPENGAASSDVRSPHTGDGPTHAHTPINGSNVDPQ